jgi:PhzF family phenazine biosynthesis protein
MDVEVLIANAFTANGEGGNPAGVVFNADHLTHSQKLEVAKAVGYSETAFVCSDKQVDFCVSFYTPTCEVDFCGHATLATFAAMFALGRLKSGSYVQRTKAGLLNVTIQADGSVVMGQKLPIKTAAFSHREIAPLLGLKTATLESTCLNVEVISTGLADAIIAVPLGYLDTLQPDKKGIADFCLQHELIGFHVFELLTKHSAEQVAEKGCEHKNIVASCRNFAPLFGIPEESATGSSNGALACYLSEHLSLGPEFTFEQGRAMNCRSIISASLTYTDGVVSSVKVAGAAKITGYKQLVI